jgi:diacylglycerol kinase family enzyme
MVTVRSMRPLRFLSIMGKALRGDGSLARDRWVDYRPDVDELVVEGVDGRPFPYQLDGDYLGEIERIELRHVPDVLDLVLPVGFTL